MSDKIINVALFNQQGEAKEAMQTFQAITRSTMESTALWAECERNR